MRWSPAGSLLVLWLASCSSPSPRPEQIAGRAIDPQPVSPGDHARAEELVLAAKAQLDGGDLQNAETTARRALALEPGHARAQAILGLALVRRSCAASPPDLRLQNEGDGESLSAIRIAPHDPLVGLLRGQVLADLRHLSAAAQVGDACLAGIPPSSDADYVELLRAVGVWCYELGEERRARPRLQMLAQLRPNDTAAMHRLGCCLFRLAADGDAAAEAAAVLSRCVELAPDELGERLAAISAWSRAVQLASTSTRPDAKSVALAAATRACDDAIAGFADAAELRFCAGVVAAMRDDVAAARRHYEAALARDADHLGALLNLAELSASAGDAAGREEARRLWRRAVTVDAQVGGLRPRERERLRRLIDQG